MLLFLKKWTPVLIVVFTAIGMGTNFDNPNMFSAYVTGFTGWLVVAMNEFIPENRKNES
jgi:hypothetical protein